jgi:ATP-dependent protease HslVU (ClpYQ) peptidase subunit
MKPKKEKDTLLGVVGALKFCNVLHIQEEFINELTKLKDEFNFEYVVKTLIPKIFSIAKTYGCSEKQENQDIYVLDGSILFAYKDNLFKIDNYGCCTEIDDFVVVGSGSSLAMGYLNQHNKNDSKSEIIIKAVKSACESNLYVNYPIIVMNNKDDEVLIIEK